MAEEKKNGVTATVQPCSSEESRYGQEEAAHLDWTPGYIKQFPWLGIGALFGILLLTGASVITLALSNNKSQNKWPDKVSPNVLINIFSSAEGILLAIAIANGVAIAWWRKTLHGATISELHRSWSFSTSLKDIVLSAKYFNIIALATITAKLTIIDSTLLQKATWTELDSDLPVQVNNIMGFASTEFLPSGRPSADGTSGSALSKYFKDDLQAWSHSSLFPNTFEGCMGECLMEVPAAGFAVQCEEPRTESIEYGNQTIFWTNKVGGSNDWHQRDQWKANANVQLFEIGFDMTLITNGTGQTDTGSFITMSLAWSSAPDSNRTNYCPGTLYRQDCRLKPALISYPILVINQSDSTGSNGVFVGYTENMFLALPEGATDMQYNTTLQQQNGYKVLKTIDLIQTYSGNHTDNNVDEQLAGLVLGLQMYVGANATMYTPDGEHLITKQGGNAANYLLNDPGDDRCTYRYDNPISPDYESDDSTITIVQRINEITFALATDVSYGYFNTSIDRAAKTIAYPGTVYGSSVHYRTNYGYLAGAAASTILCILLVLPSYYGYWELGRKVTLGPFEIAHAFRSPMTAEAKNATLEKVLEEVGDRKIQYGQIVAGNARGVVGVAEPEYVEKLPSAAPPRSTLH